jgi:hypothetical protein
MSTFKRTLTYLARDGHAPFHRPRILEWSGQYFHMTLFMRASKHFPFLPRVAFSTTRDGSSRK